MRAFVFLLFATALGAAAGFAQEPTASRPSSEALFPEIRREIAAARKGGDGRLLAYHLSRLGSNLLASPFMAESADVLAEAVALLAADSRTERAEIGLVRMALCLAAYRAGRCETAIDAATAAIADEEAAYGPSDLRTARRRVGVVPALLRCGRMNDAETQLLLALDVEDLAPSTVVDALNSLVEIRLALGRSSEAAPAVDALAHAVEELEPKSRHLRARAASLLGHYEYSLGRPHEARPHFETQIRELTASGFGAPGDIAVAHAYLGRLASTLRDAAAADAGFKEALRLMDPSDSRIPDILCDFAAAALWRRDAASVEARAIEARDHRAASPAQRGRALMMLGGARHLAGRPAEAMPLFDQALVALAGAAGGSVSFEYSVHKGRARAAAALGRTDEAAAAWRATLAAARTIVTATNDDLSEAERLGMAANFRTALDGRLSAALEAAGEKPSAAGDLADDVLVWKGQVLRGLQIERRRLRLRDDAAASADRARLANVEDRISLAMKAAERGDPRRLRIDPRLAAERDALERRLARAADAERPSSPSAAEISRALQEDEALIDYVSYDRSDPTDPAPEPGVDERMAALVYRRSAPPVLVPLGTQSALRATVEAHVRIASRYSRPDPAAAPFALAAGVAARDAAWTPLASYLKGVRRVAISADGVLLSLPFETLPAADPARTLLEDFEITYVATAADRLRTVADAPTSGGVLLVGGVAFGSSGATPLPPLPRSKDEIDAVERRCLAAGFCDAERPAKRLVGAEATEARFKAETAGMRFVHVASHGVFRDRLVAGDAAASRVAFAPVTSMDAALSALASAVAFAGAGSDASGPGAGDGFLTAAEAAWLDLSACELFVLSSCDSGLGVARAGEGLLGLRRAVRLAGARATITALWKADDASASALFPDFYERLAGGASKSAALREARLAILRSGRCEGAPHGFPALWGAFVLEENGG